MIDSNIFLGEKWKEEILERVFNEKIKPILESQNKSLVEYVDVEIRKARKKKHRRDYNSIIHLVNYKYRIGGEDGGEEKSLAVLQKSNEDKADHEKIIYTLLNLVCSIPQLVRFYTHVISKEYPSTLFLEYFGKEDFSDFGLNSLEGKLINFERLVKRHPESEKELKEKRHTLLTTVANALADFHHKATTSLFLRTTFNKNMELYEFIDRHNNKLIIPKQTIACTEKKFSGHLETVLRYLWNDNPGLFKDKTEFDNYITKIKDIVGKTIEVKKRSIFEWVELEPVGLVHGDLHGGNILSYNGNIRIIDFKKTIVSSFVSDFGFLQSPYYTLPIEEKNNVFKVYFTRLLEKESEPVKLNIPLPQLPEYAYNQQNHLREIYYLFKILDNICKANKKDRYSGRYFKDKLELRLPQLGSLLNYIADNNYNIFENYQSVVNLRDCLAEKLEDKLWPKKEPPKEEKNE